MNIPSLDWQAVLFQECMEPLGDTKAIMIVPESIVLGGKLIVEPGKQLVVPGKLIIQQ